MRKDAKLPRKFAYGMLCAVNLFPYIKNEYKNAQLAYLVRGVKLGPLSLKPIFSMLVNCFRWSETLSIAMFSKGFHEE
jgi:energy-coupling factor transport system permease protein